MTTNYEQMNNSLRWRKSSIAEELAEEIVSGRNSRRKSLRWKLIEMERIKWQKIPVCEEIIGGRTIIAFGELVYE
jgi:hypothetical protein